LAKRFYQKSLSTEPDSYIAITIALASMNLKKFVSDSFEFVRETVDLSTLLTISVGLISFAFYWFFRNNLWSISSRLEHPTPQLPADQTPIESPSILLTQPTDTQRTDSSHSFNASHPFSDSTDEPHTNAS
jgi:hypothetical protein